MLLRRQSQPDGTGSAPTYWLRERRRGPRSVRLLRRIGEIKPPSQSGHANPQLTVAHSSPYSPAAEVRCPVQAPEARRNGRPCCSKKQLAPKANHGARIVNLTDPRCFSSPARLERGSIIGEQRSSSTRAAAPPTRRAYHSRLKVHNADAITSRDATATASTLCSPLPTTTSASSCARSTGFCVPPVCCSPPRGAPKPPKECSPTVLHGRLTIGYGVA